MSKEKSYTPSVGAQILVQVFYDMRKLLDLVPEDDRDDVIAVLPALWSGDPEEVEAARRFLFEVVDSPDTAS